MKFKSESKRKVRPIFIFFIAAYVWSTMGRYCFHRCEYVHGGTLSPSHNTSSHWSHVFFRGIPQSLVPCPLRGLGYPPFRSGLTGGEGTPYLDGLPQRTGYTWTGFAVGGTPLTVSRRRISLFYSFYSCINSYVSQI